MFSPILLLLQLRTERCRCNKKHCSLSHQTWLEFQYLKIWTQRWLWRTTVVSIGMHWGFRNLASNFRFFSSRLRLQFHKLHNKRHYKRKQDLYFMSKDTFQSRSEHYHKDFRTNRNDLWPLANLTSSKFVFSFFLYQAPISLLTWKRRKSKIAHLEYCAIKS